MNKLLKPVISIVILLGIISCGNNSNRANIMGIDIVNAYEFKFGKTPVFNEYDKFIDEIGLPKTFTAFKDTTEIQSRSQLDSVVTEATKLNTDMLYLNYEGFVMDYFPDSRIVPVSIDFRKTDKSILFNDVTFDTNFTVKQFKKLFPMSGAMPLDSSLGLFRIITKENIPNLEHYIISRESVDVSPFSEDGPTIEFTFENGKLIYMYFANF